MSEVVMLLWRVIFNVGRLRKETIAVPVSRQFRSNNTDPGASQHRSRGRGADVQSQMVSSIRCAAPCTGSRGRYARFSLLCALPMEMPTCHSMLSSTKSKRAANSGLKPDEISRKILQF